MCIIHMCACVFQLLQRAQNPLGEIFKGQHLKFNDDDETHPGQMEDEFNSYAQL